MLVLWVAVRSHLLLFLTAPFISSTLQMQVSSTRVISPHHGVTATKTISRQECESCGPGTYRPRPCSRRKASTCMQCPKSTFSLGGDVRTCQQCSQCPAGFYPSQACTSERDTQCSPCKKGTYNSLPGWPRCSPCSRCALNQEVITNCSATSDTKCGSCRPGYYQDPDQVLCRKCGYCYPEIDISIIRVTQCALQGGDPMYHCRSDIQAPYRPPRRTEPTTFLVSTTTLKMISETTTEKVPELVHIDFIFVIALSGVIFLACIIVFILIIMKCFCINSQRKPLRHIPNVVIIESQGHMYKSKPVWCSVVNSLHHPNDEVAKRLAITARVFEKSLSQKTDVPSMESPETSRDLTVSDHRDPAPCSGEEGNDTTPSQESPDSAMKPCSTVQSSPECSGRPRAATLGSHDEMTRVNSRINSFSELARTRSCKTSRCSRRKDLDAAGDSTEDDDDDDDAGGKKLLIAKTGTKSAASYDNVSELQYAPSREGKNFSSSPALSVAVSVSNENVGKGGARVWVNRKVGGLFAGKGSGTSLIQMAYNKTGQIYL